MFKSPRRNGRNKGFKVKHVIQISMLLGVSMWLLYQIHQSDDDKKPNVTPKHSDKLDNDSSREFVKLGRKDLRPRVKGTKAEDEQKDETEGLEEVEDHDSDEVEEVGENEHADGKEDGEDMKEHENEKEEENDDKGLEQTGKVQVKESEDGNKRNEQNKVMVVEDTEKKTSPSKDDDDSGNDRSVRGEVENNKMKNNGENESVEDDDTSNSKQPSVDDNEHSSKVETAQHIESGPDSYSFETNTANNMKSTGHDENMKVDSRSEAQSKIGEFEQKDGTSIHEEEKDVLTDLETLPEKGT